MTDTSQTQVLITTTADSLKSHQVEEFLGVVTGSSVCLRPVAFFQLLFGIAHLIRNDNDDKSHWRAALWTNRLRRANSDAMKGMIDNAYLLGADAIVNVSMRTTELFWLTTVIHVQGDAVSLQSEQE